MAVLDLASMLSQEAVLGSGWNIGVQGATGTGRSVFCGGAPDPILWMNIDRNIASVPKQHPKKRIDYAHFALPPDATTAQRDTQLEKLNKVFNSFLAGAPSPTFGEPWASIVWDTHEELWDFIYPLLVQRRLDRGKDPNRQTGPLDFGDANAWMESLAACRSSMRPDAYQFFIVGEEPTWEKDDKGQWYGNTNNMRMSGWKKTMRNCGVYLRLWRKAVAPDRNGKPKKQVRYGEVLKFTPDESLLATKVEMAEPTWQDIQELIDEA